MQADSVEYEGITILLMLLSFRAVSRDQGTQVARQLLRGREGPVPVFTEMTFWQGSRSYISSR